MKAGSHKKGGLLTSLQYGKQGRREKGNRIHTFQRDALIGLLPPKSHLFVDSTFEEHIQRVLTSEFIHSQS